MPHLRQSIFYLACGICLFPFMTPPIALALGIVVAFTIGNPIGKLHGKITKYLLQVSVVGLGFGMHIDKVVDAGRTGFVFTLLTIFGALIAGYVIGKRLGIPKRLTHLISSGTAICGGSAIAAIGPVIDADPAEMSVSLGTVFILNAIALFIFPLIGSMLSMSQTQFGLWAAIAIHDTSSVVGAASKYGAEALQIAATVKLSRALWIIPLALGSAYFFRRKSAKLSIPYFIGYFLLASILVTYIDAIQPIAPTIVSAARQGLTLTLFLIGAGFTPEILRTVGIKPLAMGVVLWILLSVVSLLAVLWTAG